MGIFLPQSSLPGLGKYRYNSEDRSYLSKYVLKPFYTWLITWFPTWLAPNLITLLGLGFSIAGFITAIYYNPTFSAEVEMPRWAYASFAIELFLYQTLDALDGQQARRTGTSSPLGELFDHCVDAINTTLGVVIMCASLGFSPLWLVLSEVACTLNFYASTWEEYHTGKLFLSEFSGPVEGIIGLVFLQFVHAKWGTSMWDIPLIGSNGTAKNLVFKPFLVLGLAGNSVQAFNNVQQVSTSAADLKRRLRGLGPFLTLWISYGIWIWVSASDLLTGLAPLALVSTIGLGVALLVGRIIVAHVTQQTFPMWNPLHLIPVTAVILHFLAPYFDTEFLWIALGVSLGIYGSFVSEVIVEITTFLDIGCLYIKKKKSQTSKTKSE